MSASLSELATRRQVLLVLAGLTGVTSALTVAKASADNPLPTVTPAVTAPRYPLGDPPTVVLNNPEIAAAISNTRSVQMGVILGGKDAGIWTIGETGAAARSNLNLQIMASDIFESDIIKQKLAIPSAIITPSDQGQKILWPETAEGGREQERMRVLKDTLAMLHGDTRVLGSLTYLQGYVGPKLYTLLMQGGKNPLESYYDPAVYYTAILTTSINNQIIVEWQNYEMGNATTRYHRGESFAAQKARMDWAQRNNIPFGQVTFTPKLWSSGTGPFNPGNTQQYFDQTTGFTYYLPDTVMSTNIRTPQRTIGTSWGFCHAPNGNAYSPVHVRIME